MECVQLAAAFAWCASLLAVGFFHGRSAREGGLAETAKAPGPEASFRPKKRQQAARTPKLRGAPAVRSRRWFDFDEILNASSFVLRGMVIGV